MIDFFFTHFVRREQLSQIEIRETAAGHAGWQKLPQAAGVNRSHVANLFENYPVHGIIKHVGIQQLADLRARPALDQHRAKKTQRIFLKLESGIEITNTHVAALLGNKSEKSSIDEMIVV